jgi:hypothetical protein
MSLPTQLHEPQIIITFRFLLSERDVCFPLGINIIRRRIRVAHSLWRFHAEPDGSRAH